MKKRAWGTGIVIGLLALTGCVGSPDRGGEAFDLCMSSAKDQVGADLNSSAVEITNMGDALFDAEVTDERETDDANALFTVAGEVTWTVDGSEHRRSLMCMVKFTNGEPELSLGPTLS